MTTAAAGGIGPEDSLQIMFGVAGEHDLSERTLGHLRGWRDSRPVRVGNGAWDQQQVDVYGELLGAAARLADQLDRVDEETRRFLAACADTAAVRWRDRDQGIWEVRGEPQHFLYSKVMCWVALDRAIALADRLHARDRVEDWKRAREEIADAVLAQGWNEKVGAFTQYFGSTALDASTSCCPSSGSCPPTTPACSPPLTPSPTGSPTSAGWSTATAPRRASTASPARRAPSCCAPSGWPRRWPCPGRSTGPAGCSTEPPR